MIREKLDRAVLHARAFNARPPVWAIVVAGIVIWVTMQAVKHL